MKRSVLSVLCTMLLWGAAGLPTPTAQAADAAAPLVTVSFSGYDSAMKDLQWLGKLGNDPELAKWVDEQIKEGLKSKDLAGLDKKRPWGALVYVSGTNIIELKPSVLGFLPVTDLKQFLTSMEPTLGKANDGGEGVFELTVGDQTLFIKQVQGDWAAITNERERLAKAPADPLKVFGGMAGKYDLAVRVSMQHQVFRDVLLPLVEMGMAQAGDAQVGKQMIEQFKTALSELDALTIGAALDSEAGVAYVEYGVSARPDTKTAKQLALSANLTTDFAGFQMPGAAVTMNFVSPVDKGEVAQYKGMIDNGRTNAAKELENQGLSGEELKQAQQLISQLADVLQKTVEAGKLEGGLAVKLEPKAATLVAGGAVADGAQVDKIVKQFVALLAKDEPEIAKAIKLDAETFQGVRLHTMTTSLDTWGLSGEDKDKWTQVLGSNVELVLGVGDKSVWLAAGRDAAKTLKAAVEASKKDPGKAVLPLQLTVAATPVVNFAAAMGDPGDKEGAAKVVKILAQSPGKDLATLTGKVVDNGMTFRLEIQEALVRLIGSARRLSGMPAEEK